MKKSIVIVVLFLQSVFLLAQANDAPGYITQENGVVYCVFKNTWQPKVNVSAVDYWVQGRNGWDMYSTMARLGSTSNWDSIRSNQTVKLRLSQRAQSLFNQGIRFNNKCRVHFSFARQYAY